MTLWVILGYAIFIAVAWWAPLAHLLKFQQFELKVGETHQEPVGSAAPDIPVQAPDGRVPRIVRTPFDTDSGRSGAELVSSVESHSSHAAVGCCTGAKIESITIDPNGASAFAPPRTGY